MMRNRGTGWVDHGPRRARIKEASVLINTGGVAHARRRGTPQRA